MVSTAPMPPSHNLTQKRLLIGLDVGGTKIEAIAVDESLSVQGHGRVQTDTTSAGYVVKSIVQAVHLALDDANATLEDLLAIGLGIPGKVQDGVVSFAVNLNLTEFPLEDTLSEILEVPVVLENDGRLAALGIYEYYRRQTPLRNLAYMSIGTGISAGVILDGRLYRGSNGMAGEIGHIVVEDNGVRCNCGAYGCLETVAAGPAIACQGQQAVQAGEDTTLRQFDPVTSDAVFEAAQTGDPVARAIVRKASYYLGRAIYALVMTYDTDILVLGGGVAQAGEAFLTPIIEELEVLRRQSGLANEMLADGKIVLAPKNYNAGEWGAIALAQAKSGGKSCVQAGLISSGATAR